jgi:hypothetical protein
MSETIPSIQCKNGQPHTHTSVLESKVCWGVLPPSALPRTSPFMAGPSVLQAPPRVTDRQLDYIETLGGAAARQAATHLDRKAASALIDELKKKPQEAPVVAPPQPRPVDPRHAMIAGLLPMVRDGYYAVQEFDGGHVDFLRISRPKKNKFATAIKVQTVHGNPMGVKLSSPVAALWPSGTLSMYVRTGRIEDMLLLLVADSQNAARLYAKKMEHCCRCNASLTDDRSRHYGIGPECEKHWPHIIEIVDLEDAMNRL